ncbi:unnamed protein product [Linum tenue]|uniref:peroxidase n=1 Tax=Linum tenue TaxID=586396 RepID=A0AAV0J4B1_9ROSI|nr:unnamed protein product [Linum tenue]
MASYRVVCSLALLLITIPASRAMLDSHYYDQTCPQAEAIILQTVRNASIYDPKVPARLLRMFFHDCFIRVSVRSFYVIDDAKAKLEMACPQTVSCADVIAIAARDVVTMSGGPSWDVLKGRKDGRVSKASDTINLPAPTFNVSQLIQSFAKRALGVKDLVALSGGHTLGFSHCSSFQNRIRNFSSMHDVDPNMNLQLAEVLRKKCRKPHTDRSAGTFLDSTSSIFDNEYFRQLTQGKGVFGSDQALFIDDREFAASMVKLGNVGVIEKGEVRLKCASVN